MNEARLPRIVVFAVVLLSAAPFALRQLGIDLSSRNAIAGELVHTLLEWSAFCVALVIVIFSVIHYEIKRDVATPVIATALCFSGLLDAFHVLAADRLLEPVLDPPRFLPFTWLISRAVNVAFLIAGTVPFMGTGERVPAQGRPRGVLYIVLVGILFTLLAFAVIHICSGQPRLPETVFPDRLIVRPYDGLVLLLYLIAGVLVFPTFYRRCPGPFAEGLWLSIVPHAAAQAHMALGARSLFDADFHAAHFLKVVAYMVPLAGLMMDYTLAYRAEKTLHATQEKLRIARGVQQGLLPRQPPQIPGFEVAGCSYAADVVGGDYFDFLPMAENRLGIVVADVSGHDMAASILMAQTRGYLRALALAETDPGAIAQRLNAFLASDVHDRRFVSLFLMRLDPESRLLTYAAAGHQAYLIGRDEPAQTLDATGPLLGVDANGTIATGPQRELEPGTIVVAMTDGIVEAADEQGRQFGTERALQVVAENRNRPATEIVDALYQAVLEFRSGVPPTDDLTAVVLKCVAQPSTAAQPHEKAASADAR